MTVEVLQLGVSVSMLFALIAIYWEVASMREEKNKK